MQGGVNSLRPKGGVISDLVKYLFVVEMITSHRHQQGYFSFNLVPAVVCCGAVTPISVLQNTYACDVQRKCRMNETDAKCS